MSFGSGSASLLQVAAQVDGQSPQSHSNKGAILSGYVRKKNSRHAYWPCARGFCQLLAWGGSFQELGLTLPLASFWVEFSGVQGQGRYRAKENILG